MPTKYDLRKDARRRLEALRPTCTFLPDTPADLFVEAPSGDLMWVSTEAFDHLSKLCTLVVHDSWERFASR